VSSVPGERGEGLSTAGHKHCCLGRAVPTICSRVGQNGNNPGRWGPGLAHVCCPRGREGAIGARRILGRGGGNRPFRPKSCCFEGKRMAGREVARSRRGGVSSPRWTARVGAWPASRRLGARARTPGPGVDGPEHGPWGDGGSRAGRARATGAVSGQGDGGDAQQAMTPVCNRPSGRRSQSVGWDYRNFTLGRDRITVSKDDRDPRKRTPQPWTVQPQDRATRRGMFHDSLLGEGPQAVCGHRGRQARAMGGIEYLATLLGCDPKGPSVKVNMTFDQLPDELWQSGSVKKRGRTGSGA